MSDNSNKWFDFGPDPIITPSTEFVDGLRNQLELQERIQNSSGSTVSIVPYLAVFHAVRAIEFYSAVFGASVTGDPFIDDLGRVTHAELNIQGVTIYLSDEFPEAGIVGPLESIGHSVSLVIEVADADLSMAAAVVAGANIDRPVLDQWESRSGWFVDPFGHRWSPTSRITKDDRHDH